MSEEETTLEADEKELLESLSPKIETDAEGKQKLFLNGDAFSKALKGIKNRGESCEIAELESSLLGLKVSLASKALNAQELLGLAVNTIKWLEGNTRTRIPLGIG